MPRWYKNNGVSTYYYTRCHGIPRNKSNHQKDSLIVVYLTSSCVNNVFFNLSFFPYILQNKVKIKYNLNPKIHTSSWIYSIYTSNDNEVRKKNSIKILKSNTVKTVRPGCIKRCQVLVKVNIMSSDLIGGYLKLDLNQPIKWADFRLDALLANTMLTQLYTTGP
jgi:hypothetical protein